MSDPIRDAMLKEMDSAGVHKPDPIRDAMLRDMDYEEHSTYPQQALTVVEGAGRGLLGPVFTAGEKALYKMGAESLSPEHQEARQEANALEAAGSEALGFGAGLMTEFGLPAVLGKAAQATSHGIQALLPANRAVKVGSQIAGSAVDFGLYNTNNEIQKLINDAPNSVETALTNIGMGAVLGGTLSGGAMGVSALWKKTAGLKLGRNLKTVADRLGGIEKDYFNPAKEVIEKTGVEMDPVIKAGLIENPEVQKTFANLLQTDVSKGGIDTQEAFKKYIDGLGDAISKDLGHEPKALPDKFDRYGEGKFYGDTLAEKVDSKIGPLVERYEKLKEKNFGISLFEHHPNETGIINETRDKIFDLAQNNHWTEVKSSDIMKEIKRVNSELSNSRTVGGLESLIQSVNANILKTVDSGNLKFAHEAGQLVDILEESQGEAIKRHELFKIGKDAEKALHFENEFNEARSLYAEAAQTIRPLMERLGLKQSSIAGFGRNLRKMAKEDPELLLKRLSGKGDARLFQELSENFPEALQALRDAKVKELLIDSKITGTDRIDPNKLLRSIKKLSPQEEALVLGTSKERIDAIQSVLTSFKEGALKNYNWSNTGRTNQYNNDRRWSTLFGTASWLLGLSKTPIDALVEGIVTNQMVREGPDIARFQFLKWLGSNKEIDAPAFKAMGEFIKNVRTGEQKINKTIRSVFDGGAHVLIEGMSKKDEKELKKLDEKFKNLGQNPLNLQDMGTSTSHYLPEHGQAVQMMVSNVAAYVNAQRPAKAKLGALDQELEPPQSETQAFNRLLEIANQPLVVFQDLKEGTLTDQDVAHMMTMYPSLYNQWKVKLIDEVSGLLSEDKKITHSTKQGLSTFFGMPLEFSLSPEMLVSNQMVANASQTQKEQAPKIKQSGMMKLKRDQRISLESQDKA